MSDAQARAAPAPTPLAADFPAATQAHWRTLVDKALKGGDFEKRLVTKTADGLRIPPLYTRADALPEASLPGSAPFTRGAHPTIEGYGWQIVTLIDGGDVMAANKTIRAGLNCTAAAAR